MTLPKIEWAKAEYFKQSYSQKARDDKEEKTRCFFSGSQVFQFVQNNEPEVLRDSGSKTSLVKDSILVKNVREYKNKIIIKINAGTKDISKEGDIIG